MKLSWTTRLKMTSDISSGMSYLHSMSIVHRDLNTSNCFVKEVCIFYLQKNMFCRKCNIKNKNVIFNPTERHCSNCWFRSRTSYTQHDMFIQERRQVSLQKGRAKEAIHDSRSSILDGTGNDVWDAVYGARRCFCIRFVIKVYRIVY